MTSTWRFLRHDVEQGIKSVQLYQYVTTIKQLQTATSFFSGLKRYRNETVFSELAKENSS